MKLLAMLATDLRGVLETACVEQANPEIDGKVTTVRQVFTRVVVIARTRVVVVTRNPLILRQYFRIASELLQLSDHGIAVTGYPVKYRRRCVVMPDRVKVVDNPTIVFIDEDVAIAPRPCDGATRRKDAVGHTQPPKERG